MARLKFRPRDALPNTTAIARAEALYQELTGDAREALGQRLIALRAAIETQDQDLIEGARGALIATTEGFGRG